MKKLMFAALMLLSTSAAFAGDSEPLKAILKAQTYAEAADLLKANLAQITDNAEKAKAYDKLYELAMKKVSAEQGVQLENQTNKQMGKEASPSTRRDSMRLSVRLSMPQQRLSSMTICLMPKAR